MSNKNNVEQPLMTVDQFNTRVKQWSTGVHQKSLGILTAETSVYSGSLRSKFRDAIKKGNDDSVAKAVSFKFLRYGVFVAYGVGNGYIRQGGTVVRGSHNQKTIVRNGPIKRKSVDWLDTVVTKEIEGLADIAGDYYGDKSMQSVLDEVDRITIQKNYGK